MFVRFVRPTIVEGMSAREGFFCAAYELRDSDALDIFGRDRLEEILDRFRTHLSIPDRFGWNGQKDADGSVGLSWFKPDAREHIARSHDLVGLLWEYGYATEMLRTERVGYVFYEDDHQVVAEPFQDTPR